MGFAASQARFLSLTARLSDAEYEAQQISQERLALNDQMNIFAEEYEAATSNEVIIAKVDNNGTKENVTLTYGVLTGVENEGGMGYKLVTSSGLLVASSEEDRQKQIDEYNKNHPDDEQLTEADFFISENVTEVDFLQNNLLDGNFYLTHDNFRKDKGDGTYEWEKKTIEQCDYTTKIYDKEDDAAAKAKYEARMRKAEKQDAAFEMRLNQLETEHRALETEMDSLQKVIDDNVEGSYKTFG